MFLLLQHVLGKLIPISSERKGMIADSRILQCLLLAELSQHQRTVIVHQHGGLTILISTRSGTLMN